MKRALICLEQLGIGGVETFALTQIDEFNRRGIKCYVLCRDGILRKHIDNKKNIEWVEFDFKLEQTINYEKVKELEKFITKKKIDFIYIHQFSCVEYLLPIILKKEIKYVAYLHNIVPKTLEWFMDHYELYKTLFPIYFQYASKIIAITDRVKEEHINLFKLPEEKYITINNSLDFSKFPDVPVPEINMNFDNLLLFGRIAEQKRKSIYTAVKFYKYIKEKHNKNAKLTVVGDGELFQEITEMYKNEDIYFKGAVSDMAPEIAKADILLGVDRCMLEAVASKKISVICGYKENTVFVTPDKLPDAIVENFTGINLKDDVDELFKYSKEDLEKILEENYQYVKKELAITDSVFLDIEDFVGPSESLLDMITNTNDYLQRIYDLEQEKEKLIRDINDIKFLVKKIFSKIKYRIKKIFSRGN